MESSNDNKTPQPQHFNILPSGKLQVTFPSLNLENATELPNDLLLVIQETLLFKDPLSQQFKGAMYNLISLVTQIRPNDSELTKVIEEHYNKAA